MDNEESIAPKAKVTRKPNQFQPGQAKPPGSGRKKKSALWAARSICDDAGVNPVRVALDIIVKGKLPAIPGRVSQAVSDSERLKMLHEILPYIMPRLSAQSLTGADDGPIQVASLDVTKLMSNPELAAAAQLLSLAITDGELEADEQNASWDRIDGPKPRLLESGTPDNE